MVVRHPNNSSITAYISRRGGGRRDDAWCIIGGNTIIYGEGRSFRCIIGGNKLIYKFDTSQGGDDASQGGDDDDDDDVLDNDRFIFQETTNSDEEDTISTSLGINLEVVLEISHEHMLLDEISMLDV